VLAVCWSARTGDDEIYETRRLVGQKEDFVVDFSYEGPEVGRLLRQERFDDVPKFVRNKWFRHGRSIHDHGFCQGYLVGPRAVPPAAPLDQHNRPT
jgi:hypothetical protein